MVQKDWNQIHKKLKKTLDPVRYEHTKGVMYTAGSLAMAHGMSIDDAMLAGLLHDCAKCIPNDEKIHLCIKNNISINEIERQNPSLLHAKLGAYLAKTEYGIADSHILQAITNHTTGAPNMSDLDKIIYIADYIEPGRDKAPNLEKVRILAYRSLNACMAQILRDTLNHLENKHGSIDPATQQTYEFYKNYQED